MHKTILKILEAYPDNEWLLDSLSKLNNSCSVWIGIAQGYAKIKLHDKSNEIIYHALNIYKDDDTQYNLKQQLICNYSNTYRPQEALELINETKTILYDYDMKTLEIWCYSLLRDKRAYTLNMALLKEPLTLAQRIETEYRMHNCIYEDNFQTHMKYLMAKHTLPKHYAWLQPLKKIEVGATVILQADGGIGDEIIHLRWIKWFIDRGMDVVWMSNHSCVAELVNQMGYKTSDDIFELDGYIINCFHIPYVLNINYDEIWSGPYLHPSKKSIDKFKDCRGIGVRTSGNIDFQYDNMRCVTLDDMQDHIKDHIAYSLHDDKIIDGLIDKSDMLKSLDDTMGLIYNLDYVVTTCTSVAHLSCAMGKKTIIYNKIPWFSWLSYKGKRIWYSDDIVVV